MSSRQERRHKDTEQIGVPRPFPTKIFLISMALLALIAAVYGIYSISKPEPSGQYDSLAQCLTSKGVTMYGTQWCSHCQAQKAAFGTSFQYVDYVDCDYEASACDQAGVKSYPTWKLPSETLVETQDLSVLAQKAGCLL